MSIKSTETTVPVLITRRDYLARSSAANSHPCGRTPSAEHRLYYSQFVTEATRAHIVRMLPVTTLQTALAEDPHFNSIALEVWDSLTWLHIDPLNTATRSSAAGNRSGRFTVIVPVNREAVAAAGDTLTRSTAVCIAKEAARQVVEQYEARQLAALSSVAHGLERL